MLQYYLLWERLLNKPTLKIKQEEIWLGYGQSINMEYYIVILNAGKVFNSMKVFGNY